MNIQRLFTARYELQMEIDKKYKVLEGNPRQGKDDPLLEEIRDLETKRDKIKDLEDRIRSSRRKVGAWNKVGA